MTEENVFCSQQPETEFEIYFDLAMSNLAPKWVKLAPNWKNPGFFSDHISVHFGSVSQNVLTSDLNQSRIDPT